MKTAHNFQPHEVLNALEGMRRAEAPPFLHTRIRAQLERETAAEPWQQLLGWLARPAVAFSLVVLFLLGQCWALWQTVPASTATTVAAEQLPEEWSTLKASTLYDYETPAP